MDVRELPEETQELANELYRRLASRFDLRGNLSLELRGRDGRVAEVFFQERTPAGALGRFNRLWTTS